MAHLRSPVARARGLGSAHTGVSEWWRQRLTAVALVPLCLWFGASLISLTGADHAHFAAWMAEPLHAVGLLLVIGAASYHLKVGLDVVIEDYVHTEWAKVTLLVVNGFGAVTMAAVSAFAVLKLAL